MARGKWRCRYVIMGLLISRVGWIRASPLMGRTHKTLLMSRVIRAEIAQYVLELKCGWEKKRLIIQQFRRHWAQVWKPTCPRGPVTCPPAHHHCYKMQRARSHDRWRHEERWDARLLTLANIWEALRGGRKDLGGEIKRRRGSALAYEVVT